MLNLSDIREAPPECPFRDQSVTMLVVGDGFILGQTHTVAGKQALLDEVLGWVSSGMVYVAWTGRYRTDIFHVADCAALRKGALA